MSEQFWLSVRNGCYYSKIVVVYISRLLFVAATPAHVTTKDNKWEWADHQAVEEGFPSPSPPFQYINSMNQIWNKTRQQEGISFFRLSCLLLPLLIVSWLVPGGMCSSKPIYLTLLLLLLLRADIDFCTVIGHLQWTGRARESVQEIRSKWFPLFLLSLPWKELRGLM